MNKINKDMITCNICPKRDTCQALCQNMSLLLTHSRSKDKDKVYSNNYLQLKEVPNSVENSFYFLGLSEIQKRDICRIIIAILTPNQIKILELYGDGFTQSEIAKKLGVKQASISSRLKTIRKEINKNVVEAIPLIL